MKRNIGESAPMESGATPPTCRLKAADKDEIAEANRPMLTLEEWAELHEFAAWLETPQGTQLRQTHFQVMENVMVQPTTRATLKSPGQVLQIARNRQSLHLWHYRCCQ